MLYDIHPKLPMRDKESTYDFYVRLLGFEVFGTFEYPEYLMVSKDKIQIHFFEHKELDPSSNDGQVYIRTTDIHELYQSMIEKGVVIHPNGDIAVKPWGQCEFSILDPDANLLTFGESINTF
ncbi:MAG: VOC family protein [Candidatus Kapabacteria bacterium]|nr:VOC family protein [Candidatus Kapabacteria bacterium]